jgi:hypothetical protein
MTNEWRNEMKGENVGNAVGKTVCLFTNFKQFQFAIQIGIPAIISSTFSGKNRVVATTPHNQTSQLLYCSMRPSTYHSYMHIYYYSTKNMVLKK